MWREVKKVIEAYQQAGPKQALVDLGRLPSGIYFYQLRTAGETRVKQMMKLR